MNRHPFQLEHADPSFRPLLRAGLATLDTNYLNALYQSNVWLPGPDKIFNAFSLPLNRVNYVLLGESPYPRQASANGYAFWDATVSDLWSDTGLSKQVNRATSLRNMIKMLLLAEGRLSPTDLSQEKIATLDKSTFVQTGDQFFGRFLQKGFLLLNATPVLQPTGAPAKDALAWHPFLASILKDIFSRQKTAKLILFGRIARSLHPLLPNQPIEKLVAPHPYNLSFITNPDVLDFFRPIHLLKKTTL